MDEQKQPQTPPEPVHQPGTTKGENVVKREGKEPGRHDTETNAAGRVSGKTDLGKDGGVGTQAPVDPNSPHLQAP